MRTSLFAAAVLAVASLAYFGTQRTPVQAQALIGDRMVESGAIDSAFHAQATPRATDGGSHLTAPGVEALAGRDAVTLRSTRGAPALALAWTSLGRGSADLECSGAQPTQASGVVEYQHGPGLASWYVADERGIEQGMTIDQRPDGEGELTLGLAAAADGLTSQALAEDLIVWRDASGRTRWACDGLKAFDNTGRSLAATMHVADGGLEVRVDDADAVYPITIDPTYAEVSGQVLRISVSAVGFVPGGFAYRFACDNFSSATVAVPNGPDNRFTRKPLSPIATPPTVFPPGRSQTPDGVVHIQSSQTWILVHQGIQMSATADPAANRIIPILENDGKTIADSSRPGLRIAEWGYLNLLPYPVYLEYRTPRNTISPTAGLTITGWTNRYVPGRHRSVMRTSWKTTDLDKVTWTLWGTSVTTDPNGVIVRPGVNNPPRLSTTAAVAYAGQTTPITLEIVDPDGDAAKIDTFDAIDGFKNADGVGGLTVLIDDTTFNYTPPPGLVGTVSVMLRMKDEWGMASAAILQIDVTHLGGLVDLVSYRNATGTTGPEESTLIDYDPLHGAISDDGRYVMLKSLNALLDDAPTFIGVRDRLTGALTRLPEYTNLAQISGDGRRILISNDRFTAMDRQTGAVLRSDTLPYGVARYSVNRDGSAAALLCYDNGWRIVRWTAAAGFDVSFPITGSAWCTPEISDDGRRIAMVHWKEWGGYFTTLSVWTEGYGVGEMDRPDIDWWTTIGLSGDGSLVALPTGQSDGTKRIFILNLNTGAHRWVRGGLAVVLARDGSWVSSVEPQNGYVVIRTDLGTGETHTLPPVLGGNPRYSPSHGMARGAPYMVLADGFARSPRDTNPSNIYLYNGSVSDVYVLGLPGWIPPLPWAKN